MQFHTVGTELDYSARRPQSQSLVLDIAIGQHRRMREATYLCSLGKLLATAQGDLD